VDASAAIAGARYTQVQTVTAGAVTAVQSFWSGATPDRILAAMSGGVGKQIMNAVLLGQVSAAQGAQAYVTGAMLAQGAGLETLGRLTPASFAGFASDGRPLATLLMLPAINTARALAGGMAPSSAMAMGLEQMARMVSTQINDAARVATSVAMTAEPRCISYVRVVKLPACARCIILAGRQYSYSEGFRRHPKCDCGMEPMSDREWRDSESNPRKLYESMSPEDRIKRFGAAGVDAMANGSDMGQVVNARRGMTTTATGKTVTTEGATKRGIGGRALNTGFEKVPGKRYMRAREARLMPEQILNNAHGDRELQVALLRKHGYIT